MRGTESISLELSGVYVNIFRSKDRLTFTSNPFSGYEG